MRFAGKIALITGSAQGIGKAIAERFAAEGALSVVADLNEQGAKAVAEEMRGQRWSASAYAVDIADRASVVELVERVERDLGVLDILVNNAAIAPFIPLFQITEEDWRRVIDVNLTGTFFCSQAVGRSMVRAGRRGAIINIASQSAVAAKPGLCHYTTAKGGIISLTRSLAVHLAPYGIRVNSISPGIIDTQMTRHAEQSSNFQPELLDRVPLQRMGRPNDVAGVAAFLASDDASYVTGEDILAEGGSRAWGGLRPEVEPIPDADQG